MSRTLVLPALLLVSFAVGACSKKPPVAPPRDPSASAPRVDVPSGPSPSGDRDLRAPDPLAESDLDKLNAYLAKEGLLGDVFFGFDRYDLDSAAHDRLERNARFLAEHPELVVRIEGHADERGTNEYNLALGSRRADTASDILRGKGISAHRLKPITMGEEAPFCRETGESCWSQNRRARFLVIGRS